MKRKDNKALAFIFALMATMTSNFNLDEPVKDELEGIDIEKEMELIRQKKSWLTYSKRCMVEQRYNYLKKEKGD